MNEVMQLQPVLILPTTMRALETQSSADTICNLCSICQSDWV